MKNCKNIKNIKKENYKQTYLPCLFCLSNISSVAYLVSDPKRQCCCCGGCCAFAKQIAFHMELYTLQFILNSEVMFGNSDSLETASLINVSKKASEPMFVTLRTSLNLTCALISLVLCVRVSRACPAGR